MNILIPGMYDPLMSLAPGLPAGRPGQTFETTAAYLPTWVEWGVLTGIAATTAALITLGVRRLVITDPPAGSPR